MAVPPNDDIALRHDGWPLASPLYRYGDHTGRWRLGTSVPGRPSETSFRGGPSSRRGKVAGAGAEDTAGGGFLSAEKSPVALPGAAPAPGPAGGMFAAAGGSADDAGGLGR